VTDVLFNSDGIVDFFNRLNSINTLFQADQSIIDEQKAEQAEVEKEKKLVNEKKNALVKAKEDLVAQQNELTKSQANKQKSLNSAEYNLKRSVIELQNVKDQVAKEQAAKEEQMRQLERQSLELADLSNDDNDDNGDDNSGGSGQDDGGPVASGNAIVDFAMQYRGVPYVFGGTSPSGFDCSGFIWYVFSHNGYNISRGNVKTYWAKADRISSPQPGDLVFLENTYISGPSHMGIYIGGNKMVHAGSKGISVISISNSWVQSHFLGYGKF
jgi:cell wall-associated NlpC family hydrolase